MSPGCLALREEVRRGRPLVVSWSRKASRRGEAEGGGEGYVLLVGVRCEVLRVTPALGGASRLLRYGFVLLSRLPELCTEGDLAGVMVVVGVFFSAGRKGVPPGPSSSDG